jgi:hypothetical protein
MGRTQDLLAVIRSKPDHLVVRVLDELLPRWIPVEEQLPESGETVLVWHHGEVQMAWLNHFTNGVAYFVRDTHYNFEPTHWMPLPEPPNGTTH